MKKGRSLLFICFFSLFLISSGYTQNNRQNSVSLKALNEGWQLFLQKTPEQTFALADSNSPADFEVSVPNEWNEQIYLYGGTAPETFGCYRYVCKGLDPKTEYALHMKESPGTSSAFYINRKKTLQTGNPFVMLEQGNQLNLRRYNRSNSKSVPVYTEFYPDENGEAEIVILVSNYYYRKAGLWDTVYLGTAETLWRYNILTMVFFCIVIGSLVFTGLLNIFQFAMNKKRTEYFFLGIASLCFAIRIGTAGYCSLGILLPSLSAELKLKLEVMAIWLVPVSILQIIFLIYPSRDRTVIFKFLKEKYLRYTLNTAALGLGSLSLILPAYYTNRLVPALQIILIIFSLYVIIFSVSNLIKRRRYSLYNFLSFFTIAIGGVFDIIHSSSKETIPIPTLPFFILVFVIIQIIMLAAIQNDISKETIKASDDLSRLNDAYLRFVPKEFLHLLNKESIIKTKLGDYSNIEMTIIFSKVSISNSNSEVSLDDNFLIFNEYLKTVSPVIKKYDGFVSKFLSGGFMALFPNSPLDAIRAALEIKDNVVKFNNSELSKNHTIKPWMGIHFGKMIIGTIGEESRLDDTVISDTVNTASRIETVCEKVGRNIIVSEAIEKRTPAEKAGNISFTPLEVMYVKGKEKPLQLYEISRKKQPGNADSTGSGMEENQ